MNKFKIGDRVAVYGMFASRDGGSVHELLGDPGTILGVEDNLWLTISLDDTNTFLPDLCAPEIDGVHPYQCRKLTKKVRRRMWINPKFIFGKYGATAEGAFWDYRPVDGWSEFVEVRRKK